MMHMSEHPQKIMDIDDIADTRAAEIIKGEIMMNEQQNQQGQQMDWKGMAMTGVKYSAAAGVGAGATYLLLKRTGAKDPEMVHDIAQGFKALKDIGKAFFGK